MDRRAVSPDDSYFRGEPSEAKAQPEADPPLAEMVCAWELTVVEQSRYEAH